MDLQAAFLADIVEHPGDDAPRLVYADYLAESGDELRGEFIRLQCERHALCPGDAPPRPPPRWFDLRRREHELLAQCRAAWLRDWPAATAVTAAAAGAGEHPPWFLAWRRGFVEEVCVPCAGWLAHGPAVVRLAPLLRRVTLADRRPHERARGWAWRLPHPGLTIPGLPPDFALPCDLPPALFRRLPVPPGEPEPDVYRHWLTPGQAEEKLSDVCLAWARSVEPAPRAVP